MKRHIIFDLDGTLVDSLPGIAEGVNRALRALSLPEHSPSAVRKMIGSGAANLCAKALGYEDTAHTPPAELEALHSVFRKEYPTCWQGDYTLPYAGINAMLAELSTQGAYLAVLSNKPHDVTEPMVRELFPQIPFSFIMGYSGRFPRKPAPDALLYMAEQWGIPPEDITLVGDSLFDATTAANAACSPVLVAWGYAETAELQAYPAPLFHTVDDLQTYLLNH